MTIFIKLQKLVIIIFPLLFTSISFGQKKENKIFEASKGRWATPIKNYKKIYDNEQMKRSTACSFDSSLRIITDSAYKVYSVHKGLVVLLTALDSLKYLVLVKFGDYYVSYFPLLNPIVKKGDMINAGKEIGMLAKDLDDKFILEIGLSFKLKDLCAKNWINWKPIPSKKKK